MSSHRSTLDAYGLLLSTSPISISSSVDSGCGSVATTTSALSSSLRNGSKNVLAPTSSTFSNVSYPATDCYSSTREKDRSTSVSTSILVDEGNALLNDVTAADWRSIAEACPRARWTPDHAADRCDHQGCPVRFGSLGLPGISFGSPRSRSSSSALLSTLSTVADVPFPSALQTVSASLLKVDDQEGHLQSSSPSSVSGSSPLALRRGSAPMARCNSDDTQSLRKRLDNVRLSELSISATHRSFSFSDLATAIPKTPPTVNNNAFVSPLLSPTVVQSAFRVHRRHHCRRCGGCFCSAHSSNVATLSLADEDRVDDDGDDDGVKDEDHEQAGEKQRGKVDLALNTDVIGDEKVENQLASATLNAEIQPIIEMPSGRASHLLKDIFDSQSILSPFSSRRHRRRRIRTQTYGGKYFRARVCDECFLVCQKARQRTADRRACKSDSECKAGKRSAERLRDNAPTIALHNVPTTFSLAPFASTAPSTPAIIEEEQEFFTSKHRIWSERAREQKELVKTLCNVPGANRIVAVAASSIKSSEQPSLDALLKSDSAGETMFFTDVHQAIVGGGIDDIDCGSHTAWERAQRQRRKESIIDAVVSLDMHVAQANQYRLATLLRADERRRSSRCLSPRQSFCSSATGGGGGGGEQGDDAVNVTSYDIEKVTSASGWERRWKRIDSTTGGAALERPMSLATSNGFDETLSCSDFAADLPDPQRTPTALMGSQRLQRAMQQANVVRVNGAQARLQRSDLPEFFGPTWGPPLAKASERTRAAAAAAARGSR